MTEGPVGPDDWARADQSLLEDVGRDLDEVELALRRLDDGTYGTCEVCGRPMDARRLATSPAARLCEQHELAAGAGPAAGF